MCAEHTTRSGSSFIFNTGNPYHITTQPSKEWSYVVADENGHILECPNKGHGRDIKPIDQLMELPLARRAELKDYEMIAVVLYTGVFDHNRLLIFNFCPFHFLYPGPMFVIYNAILRQWPKNIYEVYQADNTFPTTIFVLVSAIQKLSRCMNIPTGTLLFRGLGGSMELPDTFFVPSEFCVPKPLKECKTPNALGYCEFGFMSTTQDKSVAVKYSGVEQGMPKASIMEIRPNSVDRGADISEFSQYPKEKEFLIVPCSFVQGFGRQRTEIVKDGTLTVIPVNVSINLKTETVEQLSGKKKSMHLSAFKSVMYETQKWIQAYAEKENRAAHRASTDKTYREHAHVDNQNNKPKCDISVFISSVISQMQKIKDAHSMRHFDDYVDDFKYKALVTNMLCTQEWAKQKLLLWLENQETCIEVLCDTSLKSTHRMWLSFLKQRELASTTEGSDARMLAAVKILKIKGLMATDDALTELVDGEYLIYAAAADGWATDDVQAQLALAAVMQRCLFNMRVQFLIDARADVNAKDIRSCHKTVIYSHLA